MAESPMEMNPKYFKYCKYYKGEETVPWDKDYDSFTRLWILERDYYSSVYEDRHEYWENEGQKYCKRPIWLKEFVSKIHDKTIRGFVAWATTMVTYNSPMDDASFIKNYRYDD